MTTATTTGPTAEDVRALMGPYRIVLGSGRATAILHVYAHAMADYDGVSIRLQTYGRGLNVDPTDGVSINGYGPYHGSFVVLGGDTPSDAKLDDPALLHDLAHWTFYPTAHQVATLRTLAGDLYGWLVGQPGMMAHVATVRAYYATMEAADANRATIKAQQALIDARNVAEIARERAAAALRAWEMARS